MSADARVAVVPFILASATVVAVSTIIVITAQDRRSAPLRADVGDGADVFYALVVGDDKRELVSRRAP